jgi:hypothetical protein
MRWFVVLLGAMLLALALLAGIYAWNPALVLVAGFEAASMMTRHSGAGGNDCSGPWSPGLDADNPYLISYFPEAGARYHVMTLDAERDGQPVELRFSGTLPRARYASIHVYDAETGLILGAYDGEEFATTDGSYSFSIRQDEAAGGGFAIARGAARLGLVWRLYLPEAGNFALPKVTLHDAGSGAPLER